jgi:hypothetical protein
MGEVFKDREQEYDADHAKYVALRHELAQLEAELNSAAGIVSEVLNQNKEAVKQIIQQYPIGMELQDQINVAARQLKVPAVILQVFMIGRQDFVMNACRVYRSKAGKIHWADADDEKNFDELWAVSYIAGWNFSQRQLGPKFGTDPAKAASLN